MSVKRKPKISPIGLGLRAVRGGGVAVAVALDGDEPRVVLSSFMATGSEDDRISYEPYHVAAEMKRGPGGEVSSEAAAAVAKGRKRQDQLARKNLSTIVSKLRSDGHNPAVAALLINRAGWVTDLLAYSLAFADHPPVAEGLAVRDALRFAIRDAGIEMAEMDEKSLPDLARQVLHLQSAALDVRLKALGASAVKPWRKEQKLACLAAWVALTTLS